jgi:hypothetical protein
LSIRRALCLPAIVASFSLAPPPAGAAAAAAAATGADPSPPPRIEARSSDLLAVGTVHGDRMTIHLSRILDNAPVRDALVTVALRGAAHSTTAEVDGSYTLQTPDLTLPGAASMQFQVAFDGTREELKGTLQIGETDKKSGERNNARQLWWWVLNFAVCIGFLWLYSRRRKAAED